MKKLLIIVLIFSSSILIAQELTEINKNLELPDSLLNGNEIRIYKGFGIHNHTGIFRMYQHKSKKWKAEFYDHYASVPNTAELKIEQHKLKPKNKMELVWLNVLKTNIQDLPNMAVIEWKLKNPEIVIDMGEEVLSWQKTSILDGNSYVVLVKNGNRFKKIAYSNPESYLKIYENVDELIYFNELLNLVKTEFGIWKND